jgi:hypothetical protein
MLGTHRAHTKDSGNKVTANFIRHGNEGPYFTRQLSSHLTQIVARDGM